MTELPDLADLDGPAAPGFDRAQTLRTCDSHIRGGTEHENDLGGKIARKARALTVVHHFKLHEDAGASDFYAWAHKTHGIKRTQADKYLRVGRTLPVDFMEGVPLGIEIWDLIAGADRQRWRRLRDMALGGASAGQLAAAARGLKPPTEKDRDKDKHKPERADPLQRALGQARLVVKLVEQDQRQARPDTPQRRALRLQIQAEYITLGALLGLDDREARSAAVDDREARSAAVDDRRTPRDLAEEDEEDAAEEQDDPWPEVDSAAALEEAAAAAEPLTPREAAQAELRRAYKELKTPPARAPLWVPPAVAPPLAVPRLSVQQRLIQLRRDLHRPDNDRIVNESWLPPLPPPPPPPAPQAPRADGVPYQPQPVPSQAPLINYPADWGQPGAYIPLLDINAVAGGALIPEQFGIMGLRYRTGEPIAINLNDCMALLLVGAPGGGKSYLLSVLLENALQQIFSINKLPQPMAALAIALQPAGADEPELCSLAIPNHDPRERAVLVNRMRALPEGMRDVVILTEREHVEILRQRNPHAQVHSLTFATEELIGDGLRITMGLRKDQEPQYARTLQEAARRLRDRGQRVTFDALLDEVAGMGLPIDHQRALLRRLAPCRRFIDDERPARPWLKAGRLVLVHLHEDVLTYEGAMSLVALTLHTLVVGRPRDEHSPKLMLAMDEGHKMADDDDVGRILEMIFRQRRHLDVNLAVATQDPDRLPSGILQNVDGIAVFQHSSEAWARALGRVSPPLRELTAKTASLLKAGMCVLAFRRWWMFNRTIPAFDNQAIVMHVRPRVTHHTGTTQGAQRTRQGQE